MTHPSMLKAIHSTLAHAFREAYASVEERPHDDTEVEYSLNIRPQDIDNGMWALHTPQARELGLQAAKHPGRAVVKLLIDDHEWLLS